MRRNRGCLAFIVFVVVIMVLSFVGMRVIDFVGFRSRDSLQEIIDYERNQYTLEVKEKEVKEIEKKVEELVLEGYNFYEKLDNGYDLDILILGESLLQDGVALDISPFQYVLKDELKDRYGVRSDIDFLNSYYNTVIWGWQNYNYNVDSYDVAILTINLGDNMDIKLEEFSLFTEALTRAIIRDSSDPFIVYLIDYENEDYSLNHYNELEALSEQYGVAMVDMNVVLGVNAKADDLLLADGSLSLWGYQWYASALLEQIDMKYSRDKRDALDYNLEESYNTDALLLNNFTRLESYENEGFKEFGYTYIGSQLDDSLAFKCSGEYLILSYISDFEGGKFQIYIDDELYGEIDTKGDGFDMRSVLLYDDLEEECDVKIIVSDINNSEVRNTVHIVGLSTN